MTTATFPTLIHDAHHHLWDLQAVRYPWLEAKGVRRFFGDPTPIQKNYLPHDFQQDIGGLPVQKSVHIQVGAAAGQQIAETAWVQQIADNHDLPNAIVAYCDLRAPDRSSVLDRLQNHKAVRGVRQIVGRAPTPDAQSDPDVLLDDPRWLAGLKELAARGLSFDLQLIPTQMERAYAVFSEVAELPVALCHAGSPWHRDDAGWALWKTGLRQLSKLPNLSCKISGLGMFDHDWSVTSLRPIFDTVIDIFGAERCMLGSNFPVDKLYRDYAAYWHSYLELSQFLSDAERRLLFAENCEQFYQLSARFN